jgi:hypothetical protein
MGVEAQRYHSWWVFAVPRGNYWVPECYRSGGHEVCTGVVSYGSPIEAINVAKSFVDRAMSRSLLSYILDDWLEAGKIDNQEYGKLMQSVYSNT